MNNKITITFDEELSETKLEQVRRQIRKLLKGQQIAPLKSLSEPGSTVGIMPPEQRRRRR